MLVKTIQIPMAMRTILITITIILFAVIPAGAVKKFDVNPINLAVVLVEKEDSAKIESILRYYGYVHRGTEDGYRIMRHPDGKEMRCRYGKDGPSDRYPTIIVSTGESRKEIDSRLREPKFVRSRDGYERSVSRYHNHLTRCSFGPGNKVVLKRIHKDSVR